MQPNRPASHNHFYPQECAKLDSYDVADINGGGSSGFWDITFWSNATNLIGVFILGMAVPLANWLMKKREKLRTENRTKEDERIAKICQEMNKPIMEKLNAIEGKVNYMDGIIKGKFDTTDGRASGASERDEGGPHDIDGRPPRGSGSRSSKRPYRRYDSYARERGGGGEDDDRNYDPGYSDLR